MVKKILGTVAGCVTVLLVLFFFLTVLVSYQDFFGQAVTWLLCGCIVILMLFVIYIMISWILDAVRRGKHDEDNLSEKSLEKLLSTSPGDELLDAPTPAEAFLATETTPRKKTAYKAGRKPAGQAESEPPAGKTAEFTAVAQAAAESSEPVDEKAEKVASARKEAEAAAAARRRAAQTAARTQAFSAAQQARSQPAAPGEAPQEAESSESIWEKMQVRQSAAPQFAPKDYVPTTQYGIGPDGKPAPAKGAAPQRTGVFPIAPAGQGAVRASATGVVRHTQPLPPPPGTATIPAQRPAQGRPAGQGQPLPPPRQGQPQGRPVQGQPVAGRPAQGQPLPPPRQGQPLQGWPMPPGQSQTRTSVAKPADAATGTTGSVSVNTGSIPRPPQNTGQMLSRTGQIPTRTGQIPAQTVAEAEEPVKRKRGRPPKPKDPEEENKPKRPRGRPPKPKDPEEENKPKRPRGRPPKPKDPEEENKPKRPRGRPRKNPLPEEGQPGEAAAQSTEADS